MKKLFVLICLIGLSLSIHAQKKSYVVVYCTGTSTTGNETGNTVYLSGDVPSNMGKVYDYHVDPSINPLTGGHGVANYYRWIGIILNKLADNGFVVEQAPSPNFYLLSKTSGSSPSRLETVRADDEEVTEVARYNLQGLPVNAFEKGIQIIVYSNYTTKTVIVQ